MSTPPSLATSRYRGKAPPPLQLKTSAFHPAVRRASRRFSRDKPRVSAILTIDSNALLSPLTARPKLPSKKEQHRRRLLKLKRTFGEEVPIAVINSSLSGASDADGMEIAKSKLQTAHLPSSTQRSRYHRNDATLATTRKKGMLNKFASGRRGRPFIPTKLSIATDISRETVNAIPSPPMPVIVISAHEDIGRTRQATEDEPGLEGEVITTDITSHWPRTPFSDAFVSSTTHLSVTPSRTAKQVQAVKRRERRQGWSGEWNQPDIQDVIERLRNIK